ncbi:50S ribosomal protein L13 [Solimonas sp. SE-A11]|uniref:50S ribosomal protein L13 n=1 Tax=Solimonas sp. SE-A11 TaxID=3054954 RepID=UPI00259C6889|nr:50S ribosomal protein L13 [Solimonas sp. SE-A11]MDM4772274.1 50S ribosomal protein L13 [Solimonas sp. SE-A11]
MKTIFVNSETVKRDWYVIDATDKVLGRVATECARRLRGKHKPEYTPNCDTGDYIVVINVDKIKATGNKLQDKVYYRHTGHPGGIKSTTLGKMLQEHPTRVLEKAVKGMLPTGPLGFAQYRKLKVYAGAEHPHTAQQPKPLNF